MSGHILGTPLTGIQRQELRAVFGEGIPGIYIKWIGPSRWPQLVEGTLEAEIERGTVFPETVALTILRRLQQQGHLDSVHYEFL